MRILWFIILYWLERWYHQVGWHQLYCAARFFYCITYCLSKCYVHYTDSPPKNCKIAIRAFQANTNGLQLKIIFLTGPQAPQILTPNDDGFGSPPRIIVGGESNRWLNISFVVLIGGIEDHDSKIFMCEVCLNHSTPAEECYTANYTSWLVGAPPNINGTSPRKLSKI